MENKGTCKDDQGLIPNDLRSGQEKRRERRKKERQDRWRKIQEYEQSYLAVQINQEDQPFLERK